MPTSIDTTLDRRARSFALLWPLFALEASKGRHGISFLADLDRFRLGSVAFDVVITEMGGNRRGATRRQSIDVVAEETAKTNMDQPRPDAERITAASLDHITNDRAGDSCRISYQRSMKTGHVQWATATFKLLEIREIQAGQDNRYQASTKTPI